MEVIEVAVRGFMVLFVGVIAFVLIDAFITDLITGTDTGSVIVQNILRVVVAAAILIGVVLGIGKSDQ